mgnify:FL=1
MTEYHEAIQSDHRALFIDIDFEKLTGGETHELREQEERVVKSNNPKIQRKYRQEMTKQFKQQNYQERLTKILQKEEISEEDIREAEKIDNETTNTAIKEEEKLKGRAQLPWSPKLKQAYLEVEFWRTAMNGEKRNKSYSKKLNAIKEKFSEEIETSDQTLKNSTKQLRRAKKNLRRVSKEASKHRTKFLEDQAELMASQGKVDMEKILNRLIKSHKKNGEYKKIKGCLGKIHSGGITHVIVPEEEEDYPYDPKEVQKWKKEYDPTKLEERLLKRNKQHFQLAQGTPFTEDPLRTELPFSGSSKLAEQILSGRIPQELKICVNTRRILQKAKRKMEELIEFTVDEVTK